MDKKQYPVIICRGIVIDAEKFPRVFEWAKNNSETLKKTIEAMMKNGGHTFPEGIIPILESDL